MNFFAILLAFLIGILSDWGNAFIFVGGYLFAWLVVGVNRGRY